MKTKVCYTCKREKAISEFSPTTKNSDGLMGSCKKCRNEYSRNYRIKNLEKMREYGKKRNQTEGYKKSREKFRKTEKYKIIQQRHRSKPEYKKKTHEYTTSQEYRDRINKKRWDNIDIYRQKELEYARKRRKVPEVRIKNALRSRLQTILKRSNGSKSCKMIELIGCTMPFLRQYLESLWRDGMSWDNYGFGRGKWVIDHIIACDKFDLTNIEQQKQCFHYRNLQPLWWEDNAEKSNK